MNRVINSLISKNFTYDNTVEQHSSIIKRHRPSMLNVDKLRISYGKINQIVINQDSSDEEGSLDETDEETYPKEKEPSSKLICEYIFDMKTLMTIDVLNFINENFLYLIC
jgi:hypothetical protein